MDALWLRRQAWLWPAAVIGGSILSALAAHKILFGLGKRLNRRRASVIGGSLVRHAEGTGHA